MARLPEPKAVRPEVAPWARAVRDQATVAFGTQGLPNRRVEAWRYSNLAQALGDKPRPASPSRMAGDVAGAYDVVFEDGRLAASPVTPPAGAEILPLATVLADPSSPFAALIEGAAARRDHAILNLNASYLQEGVVIQVGKGVRLSEPIHLRFGWTEAAETNPATGHLHVVVVLDEGAQATLLETHVGAPGFATVVTDVAQADGSRLDHTRLELLGASARQTAVTSAVLARGARYRAFYLSEGAHFARHEALLELEGEEAEAILDGACLLAGSRHCDNTTVITHTAPHASSQQTFRSVLAGKARGVYQGCVKVRREAQQTDARQLSRALLLSPTAEMVTKPELEIFADDVKCSHGATAGELDEAALFFLRARGISEAEARAMLIDAFVSEALASIETESLRAAAASAVQDWLASNAGAAGHAD
jgi:Fe-S cluster assembly protein SufD